MREAQPTEAWLLQANRLLAVSAKMLRPTQTARDAASRFPLVPSIKRQQTIGAEAPYEMHCNKGEFGFLCFIDFLLNEPGFWLAGYPAQLLTTGRDGSQLRIAGICTKWQKMSVVKCIKSGDKSLPSRATNGDIVIPYPLLRQIKVISLTKGFVLAVKYDRPW